MAIDSISYWQSTTPYIPLSTDLPSFIEVAVIGGGIIGAATCYWLAKEGIQVALFERNALAYGATGRNGGFVVAGPGEPYHKAIAHLGQKTAQAILQLTRENQTLLRQVLEEEKIQSDYRKSGLLRLAITESQLETLKEEKAALLKEGLEVSILDYQDTQSLIKTPLSPHIYGAQFLPDQGTVHSAKLVQGLLQAAIGKGAKAYQAEVLKLTPHNGLIKIKTTQKTVQAKKVVLAANIWITKLLPELQNIVIPWREQMLAYTPIKPIFTTGISADIVTAEYWQQRPDGTILIGGCSTIEQETLRSWEMKPTEKVQNAIEQILPRLFPELTQLRVTQRWAGLLDCTSDDFPIVDQVPNMPEVFMVAGFSGHGMPYGMKFGQLLAATIKEGIIHPELRPYHIDRPSLKAYTE